MNYLDSLKEKIGLRSTHDQSKGEAENFLALTLTPDTVIACVWHLEAEKTKIIGITRKTFTSLENLIHEAAVAIDKAAAKATSDVTKVVFGLSSSWFDGENLAGSTSKLLNNLSSDLDLSAQAYVSLATAVNHFLKVEEALTPNTLLLGVFNNFCEVHLVNSNKIISSETAKSKVDLELILELVKKIKSKNQQLPSRLVVFGDVDEKLSSGISQHNWKDIFMHEPKISLLSEDELASSVAYAQAADVLGHDPSIPALKKPGEEVPKPQQIQSDNDFGFVANEDILERKTLEENRPEEVVTSEPEPARESEIPKQESVEGMQKFEKEGYAVDLESNVSPQILQESNQQTKKRRPKILNLIGVVSIFKFRPSLKKLGIILAALLALMAIGIFAAGLTLTSAQVVIKVNAKPHEAEFKAQALSGASDISAGKIPSTVISGEALGSQKLVATGSKKTGTKAKGQVKVLNWDKQAAKTFAAGTQVITKDGLKFTLDSEIEVASRSATTPGENKVAATAVDIGPKYNINSAVDLTIVGFDEVFYSAVTDTAFTGGDEKQVTVASQEDLNRLEKSLTETLVEKANDDLNNQAGGRKIYEEAKTVKITKKEFDKKVDEEASLINLDMAIDVATVTFEENDLKTYLAKIAQDQAEKNQESRPENIQILDLSVKGQKDGLALSGKFRANLTPKIDENDLKGKIAGASLKKARVEIKNTIDVADVQIIISPSIPFIDNLPRDKSKISFKIETQ